MSWTSSRTAARSTHWRRQRRAGCPALPASNAASRCRSSRPGRSRRSSAPPRTVSAARRDKPTQWIVFRVTDVKTPSLDANLPRQATPADAAAPNRRRPVRPVPGVAGRRPRTTINQDVLAQAIGTGTRHKLNAGRPSAEQFAARYEAGEPQVVWTDAGRRPGNAGLSFSQIASGGRPHR